jgi:acyl-ACP thioesterase
MVALLHALSETPDVGRIFRTRRRVRLGDMDETGRVRLDALARYLQDAAIDDVDETGWGTPEHLWVLRCIRVDVLRPLLVDRAIELETWCSSMAAVAAGRRWSIVGDRGGAVEVESVWIHLGPDARPVRLDGFGIYAESTLGRPASTKLDLPDPAPGLPRAPWPLRPSDLDLAGHVNNAVYWQAVEMRQKLSGFDLERPYRALLDYRHPIDLGERVDLVEVADDGRLDVSFLVADVVKAVGRIEPLD